jgi:hypothetical protein
MSNIYTDVLQKGGYDVSKLEGDAIQSKIGTIVLTIQILSDTVDWDQTSGIGTQLLIGLRV